MASLKVIFFENMFYNEIHKFKKRIPSKKVTRWEHQSIGSQEDMSVDIQVPFLWK